MSTAAGHRWRQGARRRRLIAKAKGILHAAYTIVRPILLPLFGLGGLYLAVEELRRSPIHHNTIIWVVGFGVFGFALYGAYKEAANRIRLRRWLLLEDRGELVEELPEIRKIVSKLPPWHRARYLAKKHEMDHTAPSASARQVPESDRRRRAPSLFERMRGSAAFVLFSLVLGAVGVLAFVQWLQMTLSDFGDPATPMVLWVTASTFFVAAGLVAGLDHLRRRPREA